jgi:ABC-type multidrug transport system permease subunit
MYSTGHYFLARNIIEIPEHFIIPLITVSIYYFMVDLANSGGQFFLHWLGFCLMSFCGASLGLFLGSVVMDEKDVAAIIPIILLPMITFSGFFKNRENLSGWIGWIEYLSPNKYSFIGFMEN